MQQTRVLDVFKMEAVPSNVFPYIYRFLLQNKLQKTAKCFKKEIGSVSMLDFVFFGREIGTNVAYICA